MRGPEFKSVVPIMDEIYHFLNILFQCSYLINEILIAGLILDLTFAFERSKFKYFSLVHYVTTLRYHIL